MILNWFSPDCKKSTVYVDVKNFLWHLWTCSGYIKTSSEAGEHSAFWIRDVRHIKKKRRASRWTTMVFFKSWQNQTKIESEIFIFQRFLKVFADFTSMKNFLWHLWTCSEYVKVFSEKGEHNAFESVTYDTKKKNGALQYEQLWLFWNQVRNVHL